MTFTCATSNQGIAHAVKQRGTGEMAVSKNAVLVKLAENFWFCFNNIRVLPPVFLCLGNQECLCSERPCNLMPGLTDFYCRALAPHCMCGPPDFSNSPHSGAGSSCPGTKPMTSLSSESGFEIRRSRQR